MSCTVTPDVAPSRHARHLPCKSAGDWAACTIRTQRLAVATWPDNHNISLHCRHVAGHVAVKHHVGDGEARADCSCCVDATGLDASCFVFIACTHGMQPVPCALFSEHSTPSGAACELSLHSDREPCVEAAAQQLCTHRYTNTTVTLKRTVCRALHRTLHRVACCCMLTCKTCIPCCIHVAMVCDAAALKSVFTPHASQQTAQRYALQKPMWPTHSRWALCSAVDQSCPAI